MNVDNINLMLLLELLQTRRSLVTIPFIPIILFNMLYCSLKSNIYNIISHISSQVINVKLFLLSFNNNNNINKCVGN